MKTDVSLEYAELFNVLDASNSTALSCLIRAALHVDIYESIGSRSMNVGNCVLSQVEKNSIINNLVVDTILT